MDFSLRFSENQSFILGCNTGPEVGGYFKAWPRAASNGNLGL